MAEEIPSGPREAASDNVRGRRAFGERTNMDDNGCFAKPSSKYVREACAVKADGGCSLFGCYSAVG